MRSIGGGAPAILELINLGDVLTEIERCDASASPLFADYALTLSAVLPFSHRRNKVPWVHVGGTAADGRDGQRLRAAALGTGVALGRALDAAEIDDAGLRSAMARAIGVATAWGTSEAGSDQTSLERFWRHFDALIEQLGRRAPADEPVVTRLVRGVGSVVHGVIAGERVLARSTDRNAASIAISSFAQAVHHAAGAARSSRAGAIDGVCEGAVHGLVVMAAVA